MDRTEHEKLPAFQRAIYWRARPSFTLFALRPRASVPPAVDANGWPMSTTVTYFLAADDDWRVGVDVFDFECATWPDHLGDLLAGALRQACTGAVHVAWFMYEGGFMDIADQFSPALVECIYGIQLPSTEPKLAMSEEDWSSTSWRSSIDAARAMFLSQYPEFGPK